MAIQVLIDSKAMFILVVCIVLIAMGLVFETLSMVLIMVPVLLPAAMNMGIDPIWFCILILVQLELAGITPPFGVLLFVMKGVQQHLKVSEIYRAAMPIVLIQILLVAILMIIPQIVTTLPDLIRN